MKMTAAMRRAYAICTGEEPDVNAPAQTNGLEWESHGSARTLVTESNETIPTPRAVNAQIKRMNVRGLIRPPTRFQLVTLHDLSKSGTLICLDQTADDLFSVLIVTVNRSKQLRVVSMNATGEITEDISFVASSGQGYMGR